MASKDHILTKFGKSAEFQSSPSSSGEIADFVRQVGLNVRTGGANEQGRLLFALDVRIPRHPAIHSTSIRPAVP